MNETSHDQLAELLTRKDFVPFRVILGSGHEYTVTNPMLVALGKSHLYLCDPETDKLTWIRQSQIVAIDILQPV